ncbi:MAG: adenosine deaminase [Acidobacteriota bacterium]
MIDSGLPFIDLHRHLDGSLRLSTLLDLGRQHDLALPADDLEGLRPHVQIEGAVSDLVAFLARFRWLVEVLVDLDACRRVAYEAVEDCAGEGLDYAELRFSPRFMAQRHGLATAGVAEAVVDGARAASRDVGLPIGLIGILDRTDGPDAAHDELAALLPLRDHLVAIDLAGDEARQPAQRFRPHFRQVRDAGLGVTVHAGEADGPASVWEAIDGLGATRIGHAVRAGEDLQLLDRLAEHGIGIEANLTSNLHTGTVDRYDAHPLRLFLAYGLRATINTDDPTISGIDLRHEYAVAAPAARLSAAQIHAAQANALEIAFLDADARRALRAAAARRRA